MDVDLLMRPFEGTQIRQRTGPNKRPLDYVSGADIMRRLLDATGNEFTWIVDKAEMVTQENPKGGLATYWVVQGTLSLGNLGMRSGVGTHPAESVDSAKAAETDALKRAAVKFGVGLHLYEDENSSGGASPSPAPQNPNGDRAYTRPAAPANGGRGGNGYAAPANARAGTRSRAPEPDDDGPF